MGSLNLHPKLSVTNREEVLAAYVLFRRDIKAHRTHSGIHEPTGTRINIDVDKKNIPIGLEIIRYDPPSLQMGEDIEIPYEQLMLELFGFATQLAAIADHHREKQLQDEGGEILREIVSNLPYLHETECA